MSSSRFKKDKEIIADYESQVKGKRVFFLWEMEPLGDEFRLEG